MSKIDILQTRHPYFYVLNTLEELATKLDQIHSTISEGGFETPVSAHAETTEWLREILYLASETLNELENDHAQTIGWRVVDGQHAPRPTELNHKDSGAPSNSADTPLTMPAAIRKLGS
ncbi:MAG: hypothetical protein ACOYLB_09380 [Phototrophicaceae bacterium]